MLTSSDIQENVVLTVEYNNPDNHRDETHVIEVSSIRNGLVRVSGFFKRDGEHLSRNTTKDNLVRTARPATVEEVAFFNQLYEKYYKIKPKNVTLAPKFLNVGETPSIFSVTEEMQGNVIFTVDLFNPISKLNETFIAVITKFDNDYVNVEGYLKRDGSVFSKHLKIGYVEQCARFATAEEIDFFNACFEKQYVTSHVNEKQMKSELPPSNNAMQQALNTTDVYSNIGNTLNIDTRDREKLDETEGTTLGNKEDSNMSNTQFTLEEVAILKRLAARYTETEPVTDSTSILDAIQAAPSGKTSKKTFVINDALIEQLNRFCEQHRVKKSDIVAIALQDFFRKFNG